MSLRKIINLPVVPWVALLAAIWAPVIYLLGAQWSLFEEYQYGWAVPLMCVYLAVHKSTTLPPAQAPRWKAPALLALGTAALVYWLMRVFQEANPLWRAASLGLAGSAVIMTLAAIYLTQGKLRMLHFLFPTVFFLVAVPWPTPLEQLVIQSLTRFNTNLAVEGLNLCGLPALQQGNVIEISTGKVGISEACSGIRSLQATLMIALFFGEFYHLATARRWWLLGAGPLLAMAFNLTRTLILVFVAALAGLPTMEKWHDLTGETLLVACFLSLWAIAVRFRKHPAQPAAGPLPRPKPAFPPHPMRIMWAIVVWAVITEVSTEFWFRSHEARGTDKFYWTAQWPANNPTLETNVIPAVSLKILQCDQNSSASWIAEGGVGWRAFFLRWLPSESFYGRSREALSKGHNPAICLPASGMELRSHLTSVTLAAGPHLELVFDRYIFDDGGRNLFVFFSQTEDTGGSGGANLRMTHLARLKAVFAGSRNYGQNNLEVALMGPSSADEALRLFAARLPELIKVKSVGR